jgi:hypothetical protein
LDLSRGERVQLPAFAITAASSDPLEDDATIVVFAPTDTQ